MTARTLGLIVLALGLGPQALASDHADACESLAVIGDYGLAGPDAAAVAEQVHASRPDCVVTLGDNNYPDGAADTLDTNVGQYYSRYIVFDPAYDGAYRGAPVNRFFPALGNHDWRSPGARPYLNYFDLPGIERYYHVPLGNLELFVLDSDRQEPDGITAASPQARWLQRALAASRAPFRVVVLHHAPYSSGKHGSNTTLRWPFAAWGASLILAGHDHDYERLTVDGIPYVVAGTGGGRLKRLSARPLPETVLRFNDAHGVLLLQVNASTLRAQFVTTLGDERDSFTLMRDPTGPRRDPTW